MKKLHREELEEPDVELYFIDVGFGSAQALVSGDSAVVVDCGSQQNATASSVVALLEQREITNLRALIISHLHKDHYGGALATLDYIKEVGGRVDDLIFDIRLAHDALKSDKKFSTLKAFVNKVQRELKAGTIVKATPFEKANAPLYQGNVWNLELLYAPSTNGVSLNDGVKINATSKIFVLKMREIRETGEIEEFPLVLFTGDAPYNSFKTVYDRNGKIDAKILTVPHHGLSTGVSLEREKEIYELFAPAPTVFVSVGANSHGAPCLKRLQMINAAGRQILCSQAIACVAVEERKRWIEFRDEFWSKRIHEYSCEVLENQTPCAGTVCARFFAEGRCRIDNFDDLLAFQAEAAQNFGCCFPCVNR